MNGLMRLMAELDLAALVASLFAVAVMALTATLVVRRAARLPSAERVRLRALERRLNAVEARLNQTERDLDTLGGNVGEKIEAMNLTLLTVTRGIDRIEDFLLRAAGEALVAARPSQPTPQVSDGEAE